MKTVFVLFDSLNRLALEAYGGTAVATPNFNRLADKSVRFDTHYVGSMPCMPARRDIHTGRVNFLHRNWGPLEPFDNSFPEMIKSNGGYSHIITDHYHYFHDGGATYHPRFSSWEVVRGQSTDDWKAVIDPPKAEVIDRYHPRQVRPFTKHDRINRLFIKQEEEFSCPRVFNLANEFLDTNHASDNWFLQVEAFDPHEPFFAPDRFKEPYKTSYSGPVFDWPMYDRVRETPIEADEIRANYAATVAMCDAYLGKLLDKFDALDLWKDTALVVTTDHGFLLGEHDWWGKNLAPVYDEIARVPLFVYHPARRHLGGQARQQLTQVTDLMPTFLDWYGIDIPAEVTGRSLMPTLESDARIRDFAIYGYFGSACNITDGRHTYMRYPADLTAEGLYEYTLMPTRFGARFSPELLAQSTLCPPLDFTKNCPVLRVPVQGTEDGLAAAMTGGNFTFEDAFSQLYDTVTDPGQSEIILDADLQTTLEGGLRHLLKLHDAPPELYTRLGLAG